MTGFEEIYELSTIIMEDESVIQAPIYKKYLILYRFLQFAIGHFNARCFKDLKTIQPFEYKKYSIIGDGVENEYILSQLHSQNDMNVYVEVESDKDSGMLIPMQENEYTYNKETSTITFVNPLNNGFHYNIYSYIVGYFYDDLDIEEKTILARDMTIPFMEGQLKKESLMNQMVYGTGAKMYSQGEHIKQLTSALQEERGKIEGLINSYTYESDPELTLDKTLRQKEIVRNYKSEV